MSAGKASAAAPAKAAELARLVEQQRVQLERLQGELAQHRFVTVSTVVSCCSARRWLPLSRSCCHASRCRSPAAVRRLAAAGAAQEAAARSAQEREQSVRDRGRLQAQLEDVTAQLQAAR